MHGLVGTQSKTSHFNLLRGMPVRRVLAWVALSSPDTVQVAKNDAEGCSPRACVRQLAWRATLGLGYGSERLRAFGVISSAGSRVGQVQIVKEL